MQKEITNAELGVRLRAERTRVGYSQEYLGEKIGVRAQTIASYERGRNAMTVVVLAKIAKALMVEIEDLLP